MRLSIFTKITPSLFAIGVAGLSVVLMTASPSASTAKDMSSFHIGSEYSNESDALDIHRRPKPKLKNRKRYVEPQYYGDDEDQEYIERRYAQPQPYYQQPVITQQFQFGYDESYGRGYGRNYGGYGRGYGGSRGYGESRGYNRNPPAQTGYARNPSYTPNPVAPRNTVVPNYGRSGGGYDPRVPGASQRGFEDPQRGQR